jgi:hypothetical protein
MYDIKCGIACNLVVLRSPEDDQLQIMMLWKVCMDL